jgi:hypothetical protein
MNLSALWMAVLGLASTFLPQEILAHYRFAPDRHAALLIQILGAAYLGFAMLNWMAKDNLMGGVYSRPVAMGNMFHFFVAALALIKAAMSGAARTSEVMAAAVIYGVFAIWFGMVVFTHPLAKAKAAE